MAGCRLQAWHVGQPGALSPVLQMRPMHCCAAVWPWLQGKLAARAAADRTVAALPRWQMEVSEKSLFAAEQESARCV